MRMAVIMLWAVTVCAAQGLPAVAHEGHGHHAPGVATVNGIPVGAEEFAEALRSNLARLRAFGPREDADATRAMTTRAASQALLALVQDKLIRAEAQRRGLRVSPFEMAARLAREERRYASETEFEDALLRQGLTREALSRSLELRVLEQRLKRDMGAEKPTEAEARKYYQQHPEEFVEKLLGGRTRRVSFEEAAKSIERRLRARRRQFGYFDWLRHALATAQVSLNVGQLEHVVGEPVRLRWPIDSALSSSPADDRATEPTSSKAD